MARSKLKWSTVRAKSLLGLCAFPILFACAEGPESDVVLTASSGGITGVLELEPFPPDVMQETVLTLTLSDGEGREIEGARVRFDLTMPAMEMPENRTEAEGIAPGRYQAKVLFTMAGEWQIDAAVARDSGQEALQFQLSTR
jgi:hypothetical protein